MAEDTQWPRYVMAIGCWSSTAGFSKTTIRGYPFHLSPYEVSGAERHGEERVRIVSLTAGDPIYVLPRELEIAKLQLRRSPKTLILSDGAALSLDLSEWLVRV